jgi:hypothetical protein
LAKNGPTSRVAMVEESSNPEQILIKHQKDRSKNFFFITKNMIRQNKNK